MTPLNGEDAQELRSLLRADLVAAMKAREKDSVAALRTAIAAIDNAEAIEGSESMAPTVSEHVAGADSGVGSTEAERRVLTLGDVRAVIQVQIDEHLSDAARYESHGQVDAADGLRRQADVLAKYVAP